ncbi:AarF/ABC1/UbiB kinase family protein [Sulfidibacter corallicola]|uniref:AarF/ABC1/UbiB kinase family protein n=1 Tax=Sulfidibacter corallicola TaxID=2818388 RepID=A0A8A4TLT1_SULCO|nr:AarF/UbiB family protein [Sulfidibacter corallicola]QTD50427.1 AarF/ABC1/UbiB kinase family protein [Sulfidibacter corallicola]
MQGPDSVDSAGHPPESPDDEPFELLEEKAVPGLLRRFLTTHHHLLGLLFGGFAAFVRMGKKNERKGCLFWVIRLIYWCGYPFLNKKITTLPFPVQLRRRLELLGPTYVKLGQVLSLREDILPRSITDELKNLLDRLPAVSFERYRELIEEGLGRKSEDMFVWISPRTLGSASIAQTHKARTVRGEEVILKVVKPGIKKTLKTDATLIAFLGSFLQIILPQFQPKKVLNEFTDYTLREVDLRLEANNAETFAANFRDLPDVRFPRIYREYSCESVLCMEFFDGVKPDSAAARELPERDRYHLIEMGAAAIIRMLYKDGFFHADLHPGNLLILKGHLCGFIDLGMVGRFEDNLRRTMLYYYYCLVTGDAENAARYLTSVAQPAHNGKPREFQRAVEDISRRWQRASNFQDFSLAQLIMESVNMGGKYRMYFPMEMVLMVKALITFEGVGNLLMPGFDVAEVSKKEISKIFIGQFHPVRLLKESLRGAPEVVDALVKAPLLITQTLRFMEHATQTREDAPLAGARGTLFAGFCLLSGTVVFVGAPNFWPLGTVLFLKAAWLVFRRT